MKRVAALGLLLFLAPSAHASYAPYRHFVSRPDLKPPRVKLLVRTRSASPGYIFIAPKKKVEEGGPLILDNRGRVVWFLPVDRREQTKSRQWQARRVLTRSLL